MCGQVRISGSGIERGTDIPVPAEPGRAEVQLKERGICDVSRLPGCDDTHLKSLPGRSLIQLNQQCDYTLLGFLVKRSANYRKEVNIAHLRIETPHRQRTMQVNADEVAAQLGSKGVNYSGEQV